MNTESITKIFDGTDTLLKVGHRLSQLANAFQLVGNDQMAETLWSLGDDILEAKTVISEGISQVINVQYETAQKSSINMVKAALAGASLAGDRSSQKAQE